MVKRTLYGIPALRETRNATDAAARTAPAPRPLLTFTMNDVLESALGIKTSSKNSSVTIRVSRLLSQLGYEQRRRAARPRGYHYVRSNVPPSQRPSGLEETSWDHEELCPSTQGDRS